MDRVVFPGSLGAVCALLAIVLAIVLLILGTLAPLEAGMFALLGLAVLTR